jgi:cation transporter-like permease
MTGTSFICGSGDVQKAGQPAFRSASRLSTGVHSGTAPYGEGSYTFNMQLKYTRVTLAGAWISAVCAAGLVANVSSLSSWIVLVGFAILPPLVMMQWWNDPAQSMSESIQEVLR